MKQHLIGNQLKDINFEERIVLLSLVTGLTREYMRDEYNEGIKQEDDMLLKYGYDVKVGDLIEIIEDFTGQFPTPTLDLGNYRVKISGRDFKGNTVEADSKPQPTYCDALYETVKTLLREKYIDI